MTIGLERGCRNIMWRDRKLGQRQQALWSCRLQPAAGGMCVVSWAPSVLAWGGGHSNAVVGKVECG